MPRIDGFFSGDWGMVQAQVGVVNAFCAGKWLDVTFKIDTGASTTLLMDNDFIQVCQVLGWNFYDDPDLLNWIVTHPGYFNDVGKADCVAGQIQHIYCIKGSVLLLCEKDGSIPKRWNYHGPVYGTFSAGFLSGDWMSGGSTSRTPLLGIDVLNQLNRMLWNYPKGMIKLEQ